MLRRVVVGVVAVGLVLNTIEIQPAQSRDSCQVAIAEARSQIKSKNARVIQLNKFDMTKKSDWGQYPSEYPEKYPTGIEMAIKGSGTDSVMNSTLFLKALSSKIIMRCELVSLVQFGAYNTDGHRTFGLLGSNKVEEFECIRAGGYNTHISWGYTVCE